MRKHTELARMKVGSVFMGAKKCRKKDRNTHCHSGFKFNIGVTMTHIVPHGKLTNLRLAVWHAVG